MGRGGEGSKTGISTRRSRSGGKNNELTALWSGTPIRHVTAGDDLSVEHSSSSSTHGNYGVRRAEAENAAVVVAEQHQQQQQQKQP